MKVIDVVAAVIIHKNKYLCAQRPHSKFDYLSYKYEFAGGKVEPTESREEALVREILEELSVTVQVHSIIDVIEHQYPDFAVNITFYKCSVNKTKKILAMEHRCLNWCTKDELGDLDWADADKPIVTLLQSL